MPTNTLKQRLASRTLLVAPGVYDIVSLRLANTFGFEALYMTGYGTVASHLGLPDAGLATYSDMVGRVRNMAAQAAASSPPPAPAAAAAPSPATTTEGTASTANASAPAAPEEKSDSTPNAEKAVEAVNKLKGLFGR